MSKPDALLPCPFCGAAGMVGETLDSAWYAMCEVDACVEYGTHWLTQAEAIAAWNRRAGQSHTDGLVAALRDMLFIYRNGESVSAEYRVNAVAKADAALTAAKGQQ